MSVVCLNMFLLYLLNFSIHFSIMSSPPTSKKFSSKVSLMTDLIYTKLATFTFTLNAYKI